MLKRALIILSLGLIAGFLWGQVTIFNECVTPFGAIPEFWTSHNGGGLEIYQSGNGGYLLFDHSEDWVMSNSYDLSAYSGLQLSMEVATYGSGGANPLTIDVSNDNGASWTFAGFVSPTPTSSAFISSGFFGITAPGSQVKFRFRRDADSGRGVRLKNIILNSDAGVPGPAISSNPTSLSGFSYQSGQGPSAAQSFALSGILLSANLLLTASATYEISVDNNTFLGQIILIPEDGIIAQTIYVRMKSALSPGTHDGDIQLSSAGAESKTLVLSGSVDFISVPDAPEALDATEVTATSFRANWMPVAGAASYKLDVYSLNVESDFEDLIISEYIEGSSNNKALEIYNGTGATVNLADYALQLFSNGATSPSHNINLSGSLSHGDVYVMAHSSAHADILAVADYLNAYAISFNGNDALAIYNTNTSQYVDIFGVIGDDPGTAWTAEAAYSTMDRTLLRKPEIHSGIIQNPGGTGASAFSTLATEWNMYDTDTFTDLGEHSISRSSISYVAGYRNLDVGNVNSFVVQGLEPNTDYYYVLRAVNNNGHSENSNVIEVFSGVISAPTIQARQIEADITSNTISLAWTPGNGAGRIVVMNTQNYFNTPADGSDPVANPIYSGSGQQVIYNGATQIIEDTPFNGVLVEGLQPNTAYYFRVFEYNGFASNTLYLSSTATGNPAQFTTLSGGFSGYYEDIDGYGAALKAELHELLRVTHTTQYSYDALWTQLSYTDEDPVNSNNVIQIYTGWSIPKSSNGGGVTQWNREHTWSKSHGDFGESRPAGTDLHHLRPCDATVNSAKGNKDFDAGGTLYVDASPYPGFSGNTGNYSTTSSWEPRDEDKGDVARMIMYMALRYEGTDTTYDLEIVDYTDTAPDNEPYYGKLSTLLAWHDQDPPDAWELRRNQRIAERQGNRNPFVDHPEFAYMLWTPYPLGATGVSANSFTATWAEPLVGHAYILQVATDSLFSTFVPGYEEYNAGDSSALTIGGLAPGTSYYYRLRTVLQNGFSMFSPAYMVSTVSAQPQATTASISIENSSVRLEITAIPGLSAYRIYASDTPDGAYSDVSAEGTFDDTGWNCTVGDHPKRFYRVYGAWE